MKFVDIRKIEYLLPESNKLRMSLATVCDWENLVRSEQNKSTIKVKRKL